jgi:hypothetical protein
VVGVNNAQLEVAAYNAAVGGLSFPFMLDQVAGGVAGLKPLDALLVLAVNQANIAPLTRDPDARQRYGRLDAPAPDDERRPASVNAIAASLDLPFETVRRRLKGLEAAGVCQGGPSGVIVPASFLASENYIRSVMQSHLRMRQFYFELRDAGLIARLPPSNYPVEGAAPMRAAARLVADYILRNCELLMRDTGDVISALVLMALLAAALRGPARASDRPRTALSAGAIARSLQLPAETVRRHGLKLAARRLCERTDQGLTITEDMLYWARLRELMAENAIHVQRFMAALAERGVIDAWEASV